MIEKPTIRYFVYIRKSSDEKSRRQVLSLNAQLTELRKFAEANKLSIFQVIRESKTARKPGREKFNDMLHRIEKGLGFPIGILSWHPDRLTRNKVDETRISELLDAGKLSDLKFPTHMFVNDASGKYFLSIQMANAKYFVDKLSEDITRGQREKLRLGAWPGSRPFGYIYNKRIRNIIPHPKRAKLVLELFQEFETSNYSIPAITDWFNNRLRQKGFRLQFARNGIERILRNQLYMGLMRWKGRVFEGRYQKIIKPSHFKRVQARLKDNGRSVSRRTRHDFPYRGLFKCSCGAPITAQFGRIERLLDLHLDGRVDEISFETKHEKLLTSRLALKAEKKEIETRFPELWFEHALAVMEPLNKAVKINANSKILEISTLLQKVGSNPVISAKLLAFKFKSPYDFVAGQSRGQKTRHEICRAAGSTAKTACPLLRRRRDSNPGSPFKGLLL